MDAPWGLGAVGGWGVPGTRMGGGFQAAPNLSFQPEESGPQGRGGAWALVTPKGCPASMPQA